MKIKYLTGNNPSSFLLIALILGSLITNLILISTYRSMDLTIGTTSFLYPFKRVMETGISYALFPKSIKVDYAEGIIKERLAELEYATVHNILPEIKPTSERFAYQAGIVIDELKKLNNKDKTNKVLDDFKLYSKKLSILRDTFKANSAYWLLIQYDIDTLNILSNKIQE